MNRQATRVHIALNREGGLFVFFALGLGAAAIYSGSSGLVLLFCAILAVVILAGWVARNNLKNISIERRFVQEIFAQKESRIELLIKNHGRKPVYGLHIFDTFEQNHRIGPVFVKQLEPGETATARYLCQFPRRGVAQFCGFQIRSRFPLAFIEFRLDYDQLESAFVYPQPLAGVDLVSFEQSGDLQTVRKTYAEEHTIRELVHGRRTGKILWKLSARRQIWMESVALRRPLPGDHLAVTVTDKHKLGYERFERQISQITDLALKRIQNHQSGVVRIGDRKLIYGESPKQRRELLETLARL